MMVDMPAASNRAAAAAARPRAARACVHVRDSIRRYDARARDGGRRRGGGGGGGAAAAV
jgi:hypothetical protein